MKNHKKIQNFIGITVSLLLTVLCGVTDASALEGIKGEIPVYKGHYIGEIMPTPKEVEYKDNYLQIIDLRKKKAKACIVIGEKATIPEKTSALEVRSRVRYLSGEHIPQINILKDTDNYLDYEVVIAIGKLTTNKVINGYCRKYKAAVPEKKEGYIIRVIKDEGKSIVLCASNDDAGVYFSAQSLNQLFTKRGKYLSLREVLVIDWPSFPIRNAFVIQPSLWVAKNHEWAGMFKLNSFGVYFSTKAVGHSWRTPTAEYKKIVKDACLYAKERGLDVSPYINPYAVENRPDLPGSVLLSTMHLYKPKQIKISDPADIELLIKICRITLDNGGRKILLAFDDYLPRDENGRYVLPYEEDRKKFGSLGNAHAYLVNEVHKRFKKDYPDYQMIVCPVYYWLDTNWFNQEKEANQYLKEFGKKLPSDIRIIWTGPFMRSHVITREEVLRCSKLIGRKPFYWDNTIYDYHSPCEYLFDSYKPEYPKDFADLSSGVHFNGGPYKVGVINQMDYAWNPDAYNPETSLRKALTIVAGPDMVDTLLSFRDNYYKMKGKLHGDFFQFKKRFKELKRNLKRIESNLKDKALVKILKGKYKRCYWYGVKMKEKINNLSEFKEEFKKIKGNFDEVIKDKALVKELREKYEECYWDGVKEFIGASVIDNGYLYPISPAWKKALAFCEKTAKEESFKDIDKKIEEIKDSLKETLKQKRYKIVTLENKYIKVDIIPGLGGRIHKMVDKGKGINYLYSPAIKVLSNHWRDYGGYEEYSTNAYHSPGWNEEYDYEIIKKNGEKRIKLSCLLSNEYLLTRVISVKDDSRELKISSILKNTSSKTRESRLRIHPIFAMGNLKDNVLYVSKGKSKIERHPLGSGTGYTFKGSDLPKGFWLVLNEKENTGILNSFEESEVEICYIWEDKKSNVCYTLEFFSRVKELKPGESLSINHKYILLDDVSESLRRYEIE